MQLVKIYQGTMPKEITSNIKKAIWTLRQVLSFHQPPKCLCMPFNIKDHSTLWKAFLQNRLKVKVQIRHLPAQLRPGQQ